MFRKPKRQFFFIYLLFVTTFSFAGNPIVTNLYSADPSAHDFEGRLFIYPSHDKDSSPATFDMEDYHTYSTADTRTWIDHGQILDYRDVSWVHKTTPFMWAPDCAYIPETGKYYFYFPAHDKNKPEPYDANAASPPTAHDYFKIGVAVGDSPAGPFTAEDSFITGTWSVDPAVFVEYDSTLKRHRAYMFFGGHNIGGMLKSQGPMWGELVTTPGHPGFMKAFVNPPVPVQANINGNAPFYFFEASWVHKRYNKDDGKTYYYLSYSTGPYASATSEIHYAMSESINGPWTYKGQVIGMVSGWTNHHSFASFKKDPFDNDYWYAFFHNVDMSPTAQMDERSVCMAALQYNTNGEMMVVTQSSMNSIDAFSRIKAQFASGMSGVQATEACGGGDIGKRVTHIEDSDYIFFDDVDFGSIGASSVVAYVASNSSGGTIVIREGSTSGTELGRISVPGTGAWDNWTGITADLYNRVTGHKDIYFVFEGASGYLMNLDWFKFGRATKLPVGFSVSFKSLNPNCIDFNGSQGCKYICVDSLNGNNEDLCVNRPSAAGAWERFSMLDVQYDDTYSNYIELNSSNNGKNICHEGYNTPLKASGCDYQGVADIEVFGWIFNSDGTMSLRNAYSNQILCADSWNHGSNPVKVYDNRYSVDGIGEKFFCEVTDAPIGCMVAFKSMNENCLRNGYAGTKYLCVDEENGLNGTLCANRPEIGGSWEKFLVVDAGNGYIALKSMSNIHGQYIRCNDSDPANTAIGAWGGNTIDSDLERFQWRNNGDGTISLKNVQTGMFLCVDTDSGTGKSNNPAKTYSNRSNVAGEWEKFICRIVE